MSKKFKTARNLTTLGGGALVAASPFIAAGTANAATITVTSLLDDNGAGTTLREAIEEANADPGADVITFQAGLTGTITLTGTLAVYESVDIQGPGASVITVDGDGTGKVFYVFNASRQLDVSISGLTITGGDSADYAGALASWGENITLEDLVITGNSGDYAGGVYFQATNVDDGTITISNCDISGNTGTSYAGGAYITGGGPDTGLTVVVENSTISGNDGAAYGGGLYISDIVGDVLISNSTISGNSAVDGGGGVYLDDGNTGTVTIASSTITGNSAGSKGGGLYVEDSSITSVVIENSVVAGNAAAVAPAADTDGNDIYSGNEATIEIDYSLIGSTVGYTSAGAHNLSGDPMLGALAANGGLGKTHLPQAGSPVINAGDPAYAGGLTHDQRGLTRVSGGRLDMGAVEVQSDLPPTGGSSGLLAGLGAGLLALGGALHLTGRRKRTA